VDRAPVGFVEGNKLSRPASGNSGSNNIAMEDTFASAGYLPWSDLSVTPAVHGTARAVVPFQSSTSCNGFGTAPITVDSSNTVALPADRPRPARGTGRARSAPARRPWRAGVSRRSRPRATVVGGEPRRVRGQVPEMVDRRGSHVAGGPFVLPGQLLSLSDRPLPRRPVYAPPLASVPGMAPCAGRRPDLPARGEGEVGERAQRRAAFGRWQVRHRRPLPRSPPSPSNSNPRNDRCLATADARASAWFWHDADSVFAAWRA
jgi:hypothetical protein